MENKLRTEKYPYRGRLKEPVVINCNIQDALTPASCSKIVTDIARYILCSKLIPYPYDMLKSAAQNLNSVSNTVYVRTIIVLLIYSTRVVINE
jgi:hypothetical protein